jgi:hypothetical protein
MIIKRISLLGSCLFFLGGCGASDSGGSAATPPAAVDTIEKINGNVVPPAPDPVKNSTTLAGIDFNNNGVRDDVERALAARTANALDYSKTIAVARAYQAIVTSATPASKAAALALEGAIVCAAQSGAGTLYQDPADSNYLQTLTNDTTARKTAHQAFVVKLGYAYLGSDLPQCQ